MKHNKSLTRILKLYEDWLSTRKNKQLNEVKEILLDSTSSALNYIEVIKKMEEDGKFLHKIFIRNWTEIGRDPSLAKKKLSELFLKATKNLIKEEKDGSVVTDIGQSYYPIADRSNVMKSQIDANDRDLIIQIRHAITGGNMMIAQELIKNSWGKLSLKERNGLIEFVNRINTYNALTPDVPKGKGMEMKPLEKRSDMTKDQFAERLVVTAKENMRVN